MKRRTLITWLVVFVLQSTLSVGAAVSEPKLLIYNSYLPDPAGVGAYSYDAFYPEDDGFITADTEERVAVRTKAKTLRHTIDARHERVHLVLACDRCCTRNTEAPLAETPGDVANAVGDDSRRSTS